MDAVEFAELVVGLSAQSRLAAKFADTGNRSPTTVQGMEDRPKSTAELRARIAALGLSVVN